MKHILIAAALALPLAAQANPVPSFNDNPEHNTAWTGVQSTGSGKAAIVLPSFIDAVELLALTTTPEKTGTMASSQLAASGFMYPAY